MHSIATPRTKEPSNIDIASIVVLTIGSLQIVQCPERLPIEQQGLTYTVISLGGSLF